jgi:hypothetical protein
MSGSFTLKRRPRETIDVVSPFPDSESRPRPRWYERIRGFFGLGLVVVFTGVVVAVLVAIALLALAILAFTAFV